MRKFPKRYFITYLYCLPWDIFGWLAVLFLRFRFFKGSVLFWKHGLWCEISEESWKGMAGGIVGHGGWYRKGAIGKGIEIDTEVEVHEHFHVEQYEVAMLRAFIVALGGFATMYFSGTVTIPMMAYMVLQWAFLGFILWTAPGWMQAWIRGESMYRGSIHEEGAYAAAERYLRDKTGIHR
jgi:hypothetical protein